MPSREPNQYFRLDWQLGFKIGKDFTESGNDVEGKKGDQRNGKYDEDQWIRHRKANTPPQIDARLIDVD